MNIPDMSVCSDKLILVKGYPAILASADTNAVFPTPGDPSNRIGFLNCIARKTLIALMDVVGEFIENRTVVSAVFRTKGLILRLNGPQLTLFSSTFIIEASSFL